MVCILYSVSEAQGKTVAELAFFLFLYEFQKRTFSVHLNFCYDNGETNGVCASWNEYNRNVLAENWNQISKVVPVFRWPNSC